MLRLAKGIVQACLHRVGYKAVPVDALVLPPSWTVIAGDGCATSHKPAFCADAEFAAAMDHLVTHAAFNGPAEEYPKWRLHIVWNAVRSCCKVVGDVVEFGSYRGGNAYVISRSLDTAGCPRTLYLYDTFSGIPDRCLTERERALGYAGRYGDSSVDRVRQLLGDYASRTEMRPGFVPDSLDDASGPRQLAFIHADLNAAAATQAALRWSYPKWSPGAIYILDDYLWTGYEDQRTAVDAFVSEKQLTVIALPTGQGVIINS